MIKPKAKNKYTVETVTPLTLNALMNLLMPDLIEWAKAIEKGGSEPGPIKEQGRVNSGVKAVG